MTQKPASSANPFRPSNARPGAAPTHTPTPNTRYGSSLNSRFGSSNITWEIAPVAGMLVRFDLNGLGAALHQLVGSSVSQDDDDREAIIRAVEGDEKLRTALAARLDVAWTAFELRGAVLVYPWRNEFRPATATRLDDGRTPLFQPSYVRAQDPALVLNVLARARTQILLAASPLDLERAFLERSLTTDDPRLMGLAVATGCREELFEKPVEEPALE